MLRQRARSACGTIPGPCASATRRAAFGAGRGDFSPGTSCIGGFTTPVQAFGSQDRLPASLRTGFVISLEKPRCRPHLPRVAEVPAPVRPGRHSSRSAGSPPDPAAHSSSGRVGGVRPHQRRRGGVGLMSPTEAGGDLEPVPRRFAAGPFLQPDLVPVASVAAAGQGSPGLG